MLLYHVLFLYLTTNIIIIHKYITPKKRHESYIKYIDVYLLHPSPCVNYPKSFYGSASYSNLK